MNILFSKKVFFVVVILVSILWLGTLVFNNEEPIENETEEVMVEEDNYFEYSIIGKSVEGRNIDSYRFGNGETDLVFIGGIHGGYEWNSTFLAYEFIDYFTENQEAVPENITIHIIPSANPDGLFKVTGKDGRFETSDVSLSETVLAEGRFNANGVDINRNFDCNWKPQSTWRSKVVSAGDEAFSEAESKVIRDFVYEITPDAVIFWHSQANTVYGSECNGDPLLETIDIMNKYSQASGYNAVTFFDAYEISGDSADWLSKIGIPAITVEFKNHDEIDWEQNLSGVKALLEYYNKK